MCGPRWLGVVKKERAATIKILPRGGVPTWGLSGVCEMEVGPKSRPEFSLGPKAQHGIPSPNEGQRAAPTARLRELPGLQLGHGSLNWGPQQQLPGLCGWQGDQANLQEI